MRHTSITCTIGPSTELPEMLEKMIRGGMNVARLNMSHATHEWTREVFQRVRVASEMAGIPCAIMMDTQGPAIRTGDLPIPLELKPGDIFEFTVKGAQSEEEKSVDVNYPNLVRDIHEGDTVLVDNGVIRLRVLQKLHRRMRCEVPTEGELGSRRHVNLPGVKINMPSITEKDRHDIELGISLGIDFIALSFVRERKDIVKLREMLSARNSDAKIIAKIEDEQAVVNLVDLIDAADGIMVARGDLGIECPYEELPIIQRRTVKACIRYGKPVIVATQMLDSMVHAPAPTRAEASDVATAVYDGADCLMLSAESASGDFPIESVVMMDRIITQVEQDEQYLLNLKASRQHPENTTNDAISAAARQVAHTVGAPAIVTYTTSGSTTLRAARERPALVSMQTHPGRFRSRPSGWAGRFERREHPLRPPGRRRRSARRPFVPGRPLRSASRGAGDRSGIEREHHSRRGVLFGGTSGPGRWDSRRRPGRCALALAPALAASARARLASRLRRDGQQPAPGGSLGTGRDPCRAAVRPREVTTEAVAEEGAAGR